MTKPETPLELISAAVDCLTVLVEDAAVPEATRQDCAVIRDLAVNVMLDMQLAPKDEAA